MALHPDEAQRCRPQLRPDGVPVVSRPEHLVLLENPRSLNVFTVGMLSQHLDIEPLLYEDAVRQRIRETQLADLNVRAFRLGRDQGAVEE